MILSLIGFLDCPCTAGTSILHCFEWSYLNCAVDAAECDLGGFYEPRQWKSSLQEATDWCLDHSDCVGIVRGDPGYEPRKGSGVSYNPTAYEAWWCFDTVVNDNPWQ